MSTDTLDFPSLAPDLLDALAAPTTELVDVAEIRNGQAIVKLNHTEAGLAALRADLLNKTYDLTTTKGDKEARADRLRCVTLRTTLEKRRKELKAPAIEFGKLIDAEAKRISSAIEVIEAPIDWQIKADEDRRERERAERERIEGERVAKLLGGVATIRGYVAMAQGPGMTAARIAKGIAALEAMEFLPEAWQEFLSEARMARDDSVASIRTLHQCAVEREAEAERLAVEKAELDRRAAELAKREAMAAADVWSHHKPRNITAKDAAETLAADLAAKEFTEGQGHQQVLKAEPATADATDRGAPADASPVGGPMGAGQAAAAAPAVEPATLKLGTICERLGFNLTAGFVAETLGMPWASTDKAAKLWRESEWPSIKAALVKHIGGLA